MRKNERIAANIPAGLQSYAVVHGADGAYALDIGLIKMAIKKRGPVRRLRRDEPRYLIVADNLDENRLRGKLLIEIFQNSGQFFSTCGQNCRNASLVSLLIRMNRNRVSRSLFCIG